MTPEAQRIAIAEVCPNLWQDKSFIWSNQGFLVHPFDEVTIDPLSDLNAMHEAENHIQDWPKYVLNVMKVIKWKFHETLADIGVIMSATASQRAEAFLRTLGKWID